MTAKPHWVSIDTGLFDNPKILRAQQAAGHEATTLYLRSIAYAVQQLTDGWIPLPLPAQWGYRARHCDALTTAGLWIPLEITDDGGWLIHDYAQHQITRQEWEAKIQQRRDAARKRWAR